MNSYDDLITLSRICKNQADSASNQEIAAEYGAWPTSTCVALPT